MIQVYEISATMVQNLTICDMVGIGHKLLLIKIKEILFIIIPSHVPVTVSFMGQIYFLKPTFKKGGRVSTFSKSGRFGHDLF